MFLHEGIRTRGASSAAIRSAKINILMPAVPCHTHQIKSHTPGFTYIWTQYNSCVTSTQQYSFGPSHTEWNRKDLSHSNLPNIKPWNSVSEQSAILQICSLQLVSCWKDNWRTSCEILLEPVRPTSITARKRLWICGTCTHLCCLCGKAHNWQKKLNLKAPPLSSHWKCSWADCSHPCLSHVDVPSCCHQHHHWQQKNPETLHRRKLLSTVTHSPVTTIKLSWSHLRTNTILC